MAKCYRKDYPRPQFVRNNWENLNGIWDFRFDDEDAGERESWYEDFPGTMKIRVPFTYETKASGIQDERSHNYIWYGRKFQVDAELLEKNDYILHFEGSDFLTKVWVNGQYAGSHRGGYARFSFVITELLRDGENELVVRVEDSFDMQMPRGKQRWIGKNYGCWYVQTTGIWKTVWAEYAPKIRFLDVKMTPDFEEEALRLELNVRMPADRPIWGRGQTGDQDKGEGRGEAGNQDKGEGRGEAGSQDKSERQGEVEERRAFERDREDEGQRQDGGLMAEITVSFEGTFINRTVIAVTSGHVRMQIDMFVQKLDDFEWGIKTWSPGEPNLYDIRFRLLESGGTVDEVDSYFAMREIRIDGPNVLLNGRPLYQRLILDQGYWKGSGLTPPCEDALVEDIDKILALGYNGVRKHQKTEDERFLYWCDVKGVLVWSEMASAYRYSDDAAAEFTQEWMEIVKQNYNHPCIIVWTPFNESWGISQVKTKALQQHFTEAIYHLTKSVDQYRPVIANDGWEHTVSDIITLHDYEESGETLLRRYADYKDEILANRVYHCSSRPAFADGYGYHGQPVIISEFGGIAFDNNDDGWGYGNKVGSGEDFIRRFDEITTAVKQIPYVCGYCYTQVTDVQQEMNGLLDEERNYKVDPEAIREINEREVGYWRSNM